MSLNPAGPFQIFTFSKNIFVTLLSYMYIVKIVNSKPGKYFHYYVLSPTLMLTGVPYTTLMTLKIFLQYVLKILEYD